MGVLMNLCFILIGVLEFTLKNPKVYWGKSSFLSNSPSQKSVF